MKYIVLSFGVAVAGCAQLAPQTAPAPEVPSATSDQARPQARPASLATSVNVPKAPPPAPTARTADQFDTTTAAERAEVIEAAAKPPETSERALGATIATLGDPTDPGFWIATPLVSAPGEGRVSFGGKSVLVELRPIDGPATGGSRLSLPAMRLLEAPLTGLPEVQVFLR